MFVTWNQRNNVVADESNHCLQAVLLEEEEQRKREWEGSALP